MKVMAFDGSGLTRRETTVSVFVLTDFPKAQDK
jgi:hypothetical protein